ncbi:MAG: hypothetical protein D6706_15575 [Chloroflexi bacterium]|nr:MAG: hypothetical protein D6706_15575 [Chloroflexota bacterium]
MTRILVIGLDGASPYLVEKWRDELPFLSRLMTEGVFGVLKSITPPRSIPAWYCFATGMNPARLGVFGFSQRLPNRYDYTFANFTYCQQPPFWEWLNRHGIETAVLHLPGTFPPRPLHGFMVSGWPAPHNRGNLIYTWPETLSREIDRWLKRPFEFLAPGAITRNNEAHMLPERLRILQMHSDTAFHLLQTHPWQVALVVFSPLDRASHQFWKHMDPTHPQHNPAQAKQFGNALKQTYKAHDEQVGRLLTLLTPDDTVFIVSDHGFGPTHRTFYINEWLIQQGYLVLKKSPQAGNPAWHTRLLGKLATPLFWLNDNSPTFRRLSAPLKKRTLANRIRNHYVRAKEHDLVRINHLDVDWSRTRAYSPDESSLYLNLKGRDPQGIVEPGPEAEQLLTELEAGLSHLIPPDTNTPLAAHIIRKEDVYQGPFLANAPELTIALDNYRTDVMAEVGAGIWDTHPVRSANHTPDGLLIAHGPEIRTGTAQGGLMDIVPTIMHMLKVPLPTNMDGKVLSQLFRDDAEPRRRSVAFQAGTSSLNEGEAYSAEELAQIEKQLRDLGYLG